MPVDLRTATRLQAELDGEGAFRPFANEEKAVEYFLAAIDRSQHLRGIAYQDFKDYDAGGDPEHPARAQRTYASLLYCFKDDLPGDCPTGACDDGKPCPSRHKHRLNRMHRWLLF